MFRELGRRGEADKSVGGSSVKRQSSNSLNSRCLLFWKIPHECCPHCNARGSPARGLWSGALVMTWMKSFVAPLRNRRKTWRGGSPAAGSLQFYLSDHLVSNTQLLSNHDTCMRNVKGFYMWPLQRRLLHEEAEPNTEMHWCWTRISRDNGVCVCVCVCLKDTKKHFPKEKRHWRRNVIIHISYKTITS